MSRQATCCHAARYGVRFNTVAMIAAVTFVLAPAQSVPARAQEEPDSASIIEIEATRVLDVPMESSWSMVRAVAFSPDGGSIYVLQSVPVINIWSAAVGYWPEVLSALTGASGLVAAWIAFKCAKTPRRKGLPYCPSCNHCVLGRIGPRCAECGCDLDTRRPITGRTWLQRAGPALSLFVAFGAGLGALSAIGVQRVNAASDLFQIWWEADDGLMQSGWLSGAFSTTNVTRREVPRLHLWSLPAGIHRSARLQAPITGPVQLVPMSDRDVIVAQPHRDFLVHRMPTARIVSRFPIKGEFRAGAFVDRVGDLAAVILVDLLSGEGEVWTWDVCDSSRRFVDRFEHDYAPVFGFDSPFSVAINSLPERRTEDRESWGIGRQFVPTLRRLPDGRLRLIHEGGQSSTTAEGRETRRIAIVDLESGPGSTRFVEGEFTYENLPAFAADGSRMFVFHPPRQVAGIDLEAGRVLGTVATGHQMTMGPHNRRLMACSPEGDVLFCDGTQTGKATTIEVCAASTGATVANLLMPASALLRQLALSADGQLLAAAVTIAPEESWKQEHSQRIYLFELNRLTR